MDVHEATRIVFSRIQKVEPELASKIVGILLLQDHGDREMIRLAFGPDNLIHSLINKAKPNLSLLSAKIPATSHPPLAPFSSSPASDPALQFSQYPPASPRSFSSPAPFLASSPFWEHPHLGEQQAILNPDYASPAYPESLGEEFGLPNHAHFFSLHDRIDPICSAAAEFTNGNFYAEPTLSTLSSRTNRRTPSLPDFPLKPCLYFARGYCKHGSNCRFFHSQSMQDSLSEILNGTQAEFANEEHLFSPGTLERLEVDLAQLLRSKHTPVSIASLPQLYYERYGRTLQAEGYLTESQRHGKSGHSLTKLLARMKSIVVIERPHGQHVVVLAEDAHRYLDCKSERSDLGGIVSGSRQIYLTFPAESTFTEEDVSNYFRNYGPVQDVRIPCQQKRMFGFVTFVYPETVRIILSKGNPHFVCGARVLVKPYREKSRLVDRKCQDRLDPTMYYHSQLVEMDHEYHSVVGICENSRLLRKHLMEEHEQALEMERMRLSEFQLSPKPPTQHYFNYVIDDHKHSQDCLDYLFGGVNNGSTSEEKNNHKSGNYSDQER
ncbi:unnamed protein product [Victoria cruziana]